MEKTPDFVIKHTLGELLVKYTTYARYSTTAAYLCYMYAEECGFSFAAVCDGEVYCDVVPRFTELCPDLFCAGGRHGIIDSWMTPSAVDELSCGPPAGRTWGIKVANLRKNLIKEMIRRFGEDFEFTVNVWVCDGE